MFTSAQSVEWKGERLLRAFMPLVNSGEIGAVHVAMTGAWEGHESGEFTITEDTIDRIIARFEKQQNPMPVDYEHQSMDMRLGGPKVAAGWIQSLSKRQGDAGPELWATVEWTEEAAKYIKTGAYKFCSPVIDFNSIDRITGEEVGPEMFNLALTNNPFLDGQKPIQLTRVQMADDIDTKKEMAEGGEGSCGGGVEVKVEEKKEMVDGVEETVDVDFTAFGRALADAIGQDPAATLAALTDNAERIAEMINAQLNTGTGGDGTVSEAKRMSRIENEARENEVKALRNRVNELEGKEAAREKAAREALVDEKIAAGFVLPDQRDDALWLLSKDPARFHRTYKSKQVPVGDTQAGDEAPTDGVKASDLSEREQRTLAMMRAAQVDEEKAIRKIVALRKGK